MLGIINNKFNSGFHMTFNNGLTISVQIGTGNYCDNRSLTPGGHLTFDKDILNECPNAEIAIWNDKNVWFNFETDIVEGWVNMDKVAQWISAVQSATSLEDIVKPN
jgi:hypothetical protein